MLRKVYTILAAFVVFLSVQGISHAGDALLTGDQEAPTPVVTSAKGVGVFTLNPAQTELTFDITVNGLSGAITLAHFHNAPVGVAGGAVRSILSDFSGNHAHGVWKNTDSEPLTPTRVSQLFNGDIYVNVHTAANPTGEIRGQVRAISNFPAELTSSQEVPPVNPATPPNAIGTGTFVLNAAQTELTFDITVNGLSGAITLAHFHNAPVGVAGGAVRSILSDFSGNHAHGVWKSTDSEPLTPTRVTQLFNGDIYVNVHTALNGSGEIRGQLTSLDSSLPVELARFAATVEHSAGALSVRIEWRTMSETNNLGFNLYRSERPDGKFEKINPVLIKGAGTDATLHDYQFADGSIEPGKVYYYYLEDVAFNGSTEKSELLQVDLNTNRSRLQGRSLVPATTRLLQNFPNPFNPETWLPYELASDATVTLRIYNVMGQLVRQLEVGSRKAGFYLGKQQAAYWDGRDALGQPVPSNIYFYTLQAGKFQSTRRMVIMK